MHREQQIKRMRAKIIESAIQEFNENGYEMASLNKVCCSAGISKGIIYHYFKDKDELYLACVAECYQAMCACYYEHEADILAAGRMEAFMRLRMEFFKTYPRLRGLFFHSLLRTPVRLKKEVEHLRTELDGLNHLVYQNYLNRHTLRKSITEAEAMEYFELMQDAYNDRFRRDLENEIDLEEAIQRHEQKIPKLIGMMMYGVIEEESKCLK